MLATDIELRPYQRAAVDALYECWSEGRGDHPLVVAPTGSGKSVILGKLCAEAVEWPGTRVCVVTHQRELVEQDVRAIMRMTDVRVGIYNAALGSRELHFPITVATIQSIYKKAPEADPWDIIVIDEAHMIPPNDGTRYRRFLEEARLQNPRVKFVGLTATPYRMGTGMLDEGEDALFDVTAYEITMRELIEAGHLCEMVSVGGTRKIDLSGVKVRGGEYVAGDLARAADDPEVTRAAVAEIVRLGADRRGWLVFAAGVDHAQHVVDEFLGHGVSAALVTGDTPKTERRRILAEYKAQRIRCVVNVEVLTTGFDAPHTDLIGTLRPTKSPVLYCFDTETEILTSHGWKRYDEVQAGDCALAMEVETGAGKWSRVLGKVVRPMEPSEKWVTYEAPRANFRVTDQHRMIFQTKRYKQGKFEPGSWRVDTAAAMAEYRGSVYMPTAVHVDQPGIPLNDDELYLIGILMTDGTWSNVQAAISQSERHPEVIERIEATLNRLNINWTKKKITAPSNYPQRHNRWRYTISMNTRSANPKRGIRYLQPYLSKDLAPALLALSKSQFVKLVDGMWDGDGAKDKCITAWTPRGRTIVSARRVCIDRLQALAVMHGFTAHVRWEQGPKRKNPIGIITIKDQDWRSVGGVSGNPNGRPQVYASPPTDELVWCVETEHGTVVTRRRGKVTVMGNCQMLGRGMRPAPGKENCLLVDFAGLVLEHGPVDAVNVRRRGSGSGDGATEAPAKECPECRMLLATATRSCPGCGYEWPAPDPDDKLMTQAYGGAVLSHQRTQELVEVVHMRLARWEPSDPSRPDTLVVSYSVGAGGMRQVREWLCPEHPPGSYARRMFEHRCRSEWGVMDPPKTIEGVLAIQDQIPAPVAALVRPQKDRPKYLEVVRRFYSPKEEGGGDGER